MSITQSNNVETSFLFSAVPGESNPQTLAVAYRKSLLASYGIYFKKTMESLKVDLSDFVQKIEALNPEEHFSPALFVYYDLLKAGYRAKNLHHIFDALQAFKNLKPSEFTCDEIGYTTILTDPWETFCINDLRQTTLDEQGNPVTKPIQMLSLVHWDEKHFPPNPLQEAIDILKDIDPMLYEELLAYISQVKLYAGKILESATATRFFGAIYLRIPFPEENALFLYLRNVVHELSHLHLYAMMLEDPLVLNGENERFSSPLRADRRPMIGIFHATFVLSRIVRVLNKYLLLFPKNEEVTNSLNKNKTLFFEGFATIEEKGRLTDRGKCIFNTMKRCAFD